MTKRDLACGGKAGHSTAKQRKIPRKGILEVSEMPADSYIVRIYRRDGHNPANLFGTIEEVSIGIELKRSFKNVDQLWAVLTAGQHPEGGPLEDDSESDLHEIARKSDFWVHF